MLYEAPVPGMDSNHELDKSSNARNLLKTQKSQTSSKASKAGSRYKMDTKMPDAYIGTDALKVPNARGVGRPNKTGDGTRWAGLFSSAGPRLHNHAFLRSLPA
jgi:hypothetical protein